MNPAPQLAMASQLLKASCASYAKGLRSLQRSTGPFASHSLCLLCAGDTENSKQPVFYVEPKFGGGTVHIYLQRTVFGMDRISSLRSDILGALALYPKI
jgi:hypothetical protein